VPAAPLGLRTGPPDEPFADETFDEPDWLAVPAAVAGACGRVAPGTSGSFGRLDGEGGGGEHEQSEEGEETSDATDVAGGGGVTRGVAAVVAGAEGVVTVADVETIGIDGVVTVVDGSDGAATVVVGTSRPRATPASTRAKTIPTAVNADITAAPAAR
jgi:hypothetical protein